MKKRTLSSVKANNSFLNLYPFSTLHFSVKNLTISSVPWRKVSRLRQIESVVYPFLTREGSRVFQRSCAALTLRTAVACVNGGRGGLVDEGVEEDDMVRWWGLVVVSESERDGC